MSVSAEQAAELREIAKKLRYDIVMMIGTGKPGHLGGSCSIADIVAVLYFHQMRHDPRNPKWPDRDRFLLSKGHAALVQYAALAECGYFPKEELGDLEGTGLNPAGTSGDGEDARHRGLHRFVGAGIERRVRDGDGGKDRQERLQGLLHRRRWGNRRGTDLGGLDGGGRATSWTTSLRSSTRTWCRRPVRSSIDTTRIPTPRNGRAFGWQVMQIDGHDIEQIAEALDEAGRVKGRPVMIVAQTVKSKGVPFAEGKPEFHHGIMTQEQYEAARRLFED